MLWRSRDNTGCLNFNISSAALSVLGNIVILNQKVSLHGRTEAKKWAQHFIALDEIAIGRLPVAASLTRRGYPIQHGSSKIKCLHRSNSRKF